MTGRDRRFIAAAIFLLSTSCGGDSSPTAPSDPAAATATSLTVTLVAVGNDYQATAVAGFSDGTTTEVTTAVTWSTSDTTIATVNESGYVTAMANGTVNIIATYDGVTGQAALTITTVSTPDPPPPSATVTSIAVSASATTMTVGATVTVTATATYSDGTTATVTPTWSSSNESVATVSASGTVTGVATGTATITGTSGEQSGSVDIAVTAAMARLWGTIDNADTGAVVANATVEVVNGANSGRQTESNSSGVYELNGLVQDLFEVRVTASHFDDTSFTVNLQGDSRRDASITLDKPWTVAGTVTDDLRNVPAANVRVEASSRMSGVPDQLTSISLSATPSPMRLDTTVCLASRGARRRFGLRLK